MPIFVGLSLAWPDSANLALKGAAEFAKEQSLLRKVTDKVDPWTKDAGSIKANPMKIHNNLVSNF